MIQEAHYGTKFTWPSDWNTGFTALEGHTAYLPAATADTPLSRYGDAWSHKDAFTNHAFYTEHEYHWNIIPVASAGEGGSGRFECDEHNWTSFDPDNPRDTRHQIWYRTATCGDGKTEGGEQCDDGNEDEADGCTSACQLYTDATDCLDVLEQAPASPSGVYTIDPDGPGGDAPVTAYCDMTTEGGGWTRCAEQHATTASLLDWQDEGTADNWYACHHLASEEGLARVQASNDLGDTQAWRFEGVDPVLGVAGLADTTGLALLNIYKDSAHGTCENAETDPDNYQVMVESTAALFGLAPASDNTCVGWEDTLFLFGRGAHGDGCTTIAQLVPNLGYPCGSYDEQAIRFEVSVRRSACGNGDVEPGEACDDGGPTATCSAECTVIGP